MNTDQKKEAAIAEKVSKGLSGLVSILGTVLSNNPDLLMKVFENNPQLIMQNIDPSILISSKINQASDFI